MHAINPHITLNVAFVRIPEEVLVGVGAVSTATAFVAAGFVTTGIVAVTVLKSIFGSFKVEITQSSDSAKNVNLKTINYCS